MGLVTDTLIKLIQRQIDERGLVVWFDPTGTYAALAADLQPDNTRVAHFRGSFLALRREVDALLNDVENDRPPRLVIYVPNQDPAAVTDLLGEFVAGGAVMKPGGQSLPLNTSLESVARRALKSAIPEQIDNVCDQIAKGQITSLAELDQLTDNTAQIGQGVIRLIFDTGLASDVALKFLTDSSADKDLSAKHAVPELAALLTETFGVTLPADDQPEALRARLRKHVLIVEFCVSLQGRLPKALTTLKLPEQPAARQACVQLVRAWRNRRDLQQSYLDAAQRTEKDYCLSSSQFDWQTLRDTDTFRVVDEALQAGVEQALVQRAAAEWLTLAAERQAGFWAEVDQDSRARWTLIATAGQVLREADRIASDLQKMGTATALDLIERYTAADTPWCSLDTHQRVMERLCRSYDLTDDRHATLEQLLARARQQYMRVTDDLAQRFVTALADANFILGGLLYQTEVYQRQVSPAMGHGKTAYVLVDALRYEMARDLAGNLNKDWRIELQPAMGTAPTITAIGMAALLPGAERGVALTEAGGKLALEINGKAFKERKERVKYLSDLIPGLYETKLDALVPANKATREAVRQASFVLVTSQEIDLLGEGDSIGHAREFMDTTLPKLARAFRVLVDLGVQRIIVAADHGYLFGDELDDDLTLPAPGGYTADLHRRVWIGRGGQLIDHVLRVPVQALNVGGDLELATPIGLACFKAGGNKSYLHGGLSLQELIIPVLMLQPVTAPTTASAQIEWKLKPGANKITTRFYSVQVSGQAVGMFDLVPPRVRLEVRAKNKTLSMPAQATYGYQDATGEVELQRKPDSPSEIDPNTIMVMITGETDQKTVSVVLVDAETDKTLETLDKVEFAISI